MELKTVIYTKEDEIAWVKLNRPESLNAVNEEMINDLIVAGNMAGEDKDIRVIVITGNENVFGAGADIRAFVDYTPSDAHNYIYQVQKSVGNLLALGKPTIASIAGYALGGGFEMAMACDLRIAADNVTMGLPEIKLGIIPGGGATQRLTRLIGEGKAKELILLGEIFSAQRAYELGLINYLVPLKDLREETIKLAKRLANKPPIALRTARELIQLSYDLDLVNGLMIEKEKFAYLFSTQDQKEGMKAFLEGRKPVFKGE